MKFWEEEVFCIRTTEVDRYCRAREDFGNRGGKICIVIVIG